MIFYLKIINFLQFHQENKIQKKKQHDKIVVLDKLWDYMLTDFLIFYSRKKRAKNKRVEIWVETSIYSYSMVFGIYQLTVFGVSVRFFCLLK